MQQIVYKLNPFPNSHDLFTWKENQFLDLDVLQSELSEKDGYIKM